MKERKALIATIGYSIGIIWGLYCESNIAFLYGIIISVTCIINFVRCKKHEFKLISLSRYLKYLKIVINYETIILLIIFSLISNILVNVANKKYENLYENEEQIELIAKVISNENENLKKYIIRVIAPQRFKNTKLIITSNMELRYGDKVQIGGIYREPELARNYGGFNYKNYLKTKKIYGTLKVENIYKIKENTNNYIFTLSNDLFLKIKDNIEKLYSKEKANLLLGMMLGYTEDIDDATKEKFKISNISHVLAVSGMHVMYLVMGISLLLSNFIGKRKTKVITTIVLIIYMFITNFSPSVVRAGVMAIIFQLSSILHRKNDTATTISISLLIILIYNPFLITSVSVLLSYAGTIGIILFSKNIFTILKKIRIKNKRIRYRVNKNILKLDLKVKNILSVIISAQILIMPIMIYLNNTISFSLIVTNLLLSLVIGSIVILGFVQIFVSLISINLSKILCMFLTFSLDVMIKISKLGNVLPLSKIYIATPGIVAVIMFYFSVILVNYIYTINSLKNKNSFQIRIKNLLSLFKYKLRINKLKVQKILILILFVSLLFLIFPNNLKIYFIDVGQGDSTLIVTPLNKTILIDGGGSLNKEYDVGKNTLLPYLLDRKIKKINYMIISHFDQDHIRAVCLQLWKS